MAKTFSILTLGCKVNQYESEAMSELFEKEVTRKLIMTNLATYIL